MADEQAPARTDAPGEPACGPILAPVRRRGELHLLALMSAAAVVFVAIAIAKPWGEGAPPSRASVATPSQAAELARSSPESAASAASAATPSLPADTAQQVFIVVQPGDVAITYTVVCTGDPGVSPPVMESAEPVMETAEPVIGFRYAPGGLVCTSADLQVVDWVLASPSAP